MHWKAPVRRRRFLDYPVEKEITLTPSATVTNALVRVPLIGDSTFQDYANNPEGAVIARDGDGTELPVWVASSGALAQRDGSTGSWHSTPNAIYMNGSFYTAGIATNIDGSNNSILKTTKYDPSTDTYTFNSFTIADASSGDDHNDPVLLNLPNNYLLYCCPEHNTGRDIWYGLTQSADDVDWNTQQTLTTGGVTDVVSYSQLLYLSGIGSGGTIVLIYRLKEGGTKMSWRYRTAEYGDGAGSADVNVTTGTVTWGTETALWETASNTTYLESAGDGVNTIHFMTSIGNPPASGSQSIYHFYTSSFSTWHATDGTSLTPGGDGITPAIIDAASSSSLVMKYDDGLGFTSDDAMNTGDICVRGNNVILQVIRFRGEGNTINGADTTSSPGAITSRAYHCVSTSGGSWSISQIPYELAHRCIQSDGNIDHYYSCFACICPRDPANAAYICTQVNSTSRFSRLWRVRRITDGSWIVDKRISKSDSMKHYLPRRVYGEHPYDGSIGGEIVWNAGDEYINVGAVSRLYTSTRFHPVAGSYAAYAWVKVPSVSNGDKIYIRGGGTSSTSNAFSDTDVFDDFDVAILLGEEDDEAISTFRDRSGNGNDVSRIFDLDCGEMTGIYGVSLNKTSSDTGDLHHLELETSAGFFNSSAEVTLVAAIRPIESLGDANEHCIIGNLYSAGETGKSEVYIRFEPGTNRIEGNFTMTDATGFSGGIVTATNTAPDVTDTLVAMRFDSDGDTNATGVITTDGTDGTVKTHTSSTTMGASNADDSVHFGQRAGNADEFYGTIGMILISKTEAKSDAWVKLLHDSVNNTGSCVSGSGVLGVTV